MKGFMHDLETLLRMHEYSWGIKQTPIERVIIPISLIACFVVMVYFGNHCNV